MRANDIGKLGERIASKYLKKHGYKIVDMNVHVSHNEIDIIAKNKKYIVFVEVKTRSTAVDLVSDFGSPASFVTHTKRQRTIDAARGFLRSGRYSLLQPRFDVIEVFLNKTDSKLLYINHIMDAFGA